MGHWENEQLGKLDEWASKRVGELASWRLGK